MHFKGCVGLPLLETISRTAEEAPGGLSPLLFLEEGECPAPFLFFVILK